MNLPVWAEALVSSAYFAAGVLTATLLSHRPFGDKKALTYPTDFLTGICAGALFIGVTEIFFGGVAGVAAYSAYAIGIATYAAAQLTKEPVKREACRSRTPAKTGCERKRLPILKKQRCLKKRPNERDRNCSNAGFGRAARRGRR